MAHDGDGMVSAVGPTQGEVLKERFGSVSWRRVFGDALRERLGNGPTALPERLEGAVYGALVGAMQVSSPAADAIATLDVLDALLDGNLMPVGGGSPVDVLPLPLVLRDAEPGDLAHRAAVHGSAGGGSGVGCALFALVVRHLLAGERGRREILIRATRDLHHAHLAGRAEHCPCRAGWSAFARANGYEEAVRLAREAEPGPSCPSAAVAGALAGLYWGSSAIPAPWRRRLPEPRRTRTLVDRLVETARPARDGEPWITSTASPLPLYGVDLDGLDGLEDGGVGITFLPGKRYVGYHTGAHWRDLDTDARRLRDLHVDVLLLLVEDAELERCRATGIADAMCDQGIALVRHPIRDPLLPDDRAAFRARIVSLVERVRAGGSVAIACRGGFDRSGMAAACLLREAGLSADEAIGRVHHARPGALTLPDQQALVRGWQDQP